MTSETQREFENTVARAGVDLDMFDFCRMDQPHGYAMTVCPRCSEQADVHRKPAGVLLICTKCGTEAEWECAAENTAFGAAGSIRLVRMSLPRNVLPDDDTETAESITIELVETNVFTRWPCTVCGGCTEKVAILAEGQDRQGLVRVCKTCLEKGDIDERLEKRAAALDEVNREYTLELIGRLKVPAYTDWCKAMREVEVRDVMGIDGVNREEAEARVHPNWPAVSHEDHERWLCNAPGAIVIDINERQRTAADPDGPIPF